MVVRLAGIPGPCTSGPSDPASVALAPSTRAAWWMLAGTTQPLTALRRRPTVGAEPERSPQGAGPARRARTRPRRAGRSGGPAHVLLIAPSGHSVARHAHRAPAAVRPAGHRRVWLAGTGSARQHVRLGPHARRRWPADQRHRHACRAPPDSVDIDDTAWRQQLAEAATDVEAWTGNRLSWLELSQSEVAAASAAGEAIVTEWRRDAVPPAGAPLEDLLQKG